MNDAVLHAIKIVAVIAVLQGLLAYVVLLERRLAAWLQDRVGPNRVGPLGLLQPVADGVKFLFKEQFIPAHVNKFYYWLAPAVTMIPAFLTLAVIPFGSSMGAQKMVIADLNVGVLWIFSIASLGVYGIVLAGWASNSKYPFFGGIRSSAQLISYEICMGLSVVGIFMQVGSLNLSAIIAYQTTHVWLIFYQPLAFLIFLIAAFAETNRLPFDLPEAETELVAGYHTEYGSMKFAMFYLAEYASMITVSALMVTLFFGGWTLPWFGLDMPARTIPQGIAHILVFLIKVMIFMVFFMWVRWTLPRFRFDQLMGLGWKIFLPAALVNIVLTGLCIIKFGGAK